MKLHYFIIPLLILSFVFLDNYRLKAYNKVTERENLELKQLEKFKPLNDSLKEISSHEYTNNYGCLKFSQDLKDSLEKKGIQSEIEIGESPKTLLEPKIKHAWVSVWFESETGTFTKNYTK
jgi:hypothetical protein